MKSGVGASEKLLCVKVQFVEMTVRVEGLMRVKGVATRASKAEGAVRCLAA